MKNAVGSWVVGGPYLAGSQRALPGVCMLVCMGMHICTYMYIHIVSESLVVWK